MVYQQTVEVQISPILNFLSKKCKKFFKLKISTHDNAPQSMPFAFDN